MMVPNSETNYIFIIILWAAIVCLGITFLAAIWISIFRRSPAAEKEPVESLEISAEAADDGLL